MPAPSLIRLRFTLNGQPVAVQCQPGTRLLDLLREEFDLREAREGCGRGECGACLVLMDGRAVNACLVPAFMLADSEIVTAEGLAQQKEHADLRRALAAYDLSGCGYCEAGLTIALAALLLGDPDPGEEDVHRAIAGNRCVCGAQVRGPRYAAPGPRGPAAGRRHGRR